MLSDPVLIAIVTAASALGGALIAALPLLVVAFKTQSKVSEVQTKVAEIHQLANSMKDELVRVTRSDALQEGHAAGVADEQLKRVED